MTPFRWAVLGTGGISAKFVAGLSHAQDATATVVASRDLDRARRLAAAVGVPDAVAGYEAVLGRDDVDAVYVATPPSEHARQALLCIEAGLPVLLEKPFTADPEEARAVASAARNAGVFVMEAMWTRFLPAAQAFREVVRGGDLGEARMARGSFGVSQSPGHSSMFDAGLGGGALTHLGVYPLSLGQWLFGTPELVRATGTVGRSGIDEDAAVVLRYPGGVIGSYVASLRAWAPDDFHVLAERGMVGFRGSIVRPLGITVEQRAPHAGEPSPFGRRARLRQHAAVHRLAQFLGRGSRGAGRRLARPYAGNGYGHEADEVRACVRAGATESTIMPLADSIAVVDTTHLARAQLLSTQSRGSRGDVS